MPIRRSKSHRNYDHRFHIEMWEEDRDMLSAVAKVDGESGAAVLRRLLRNEYRRMVKEGYIDGPLVIAPKRKQK